MREKNWNIFEIGFMKDTLEADFIKKKMSPDMIDENISYCQAKIRNIMLEIAVLDKMKNNRKSFKPLKSIRWMYI